MNPVTAANALVSSAGLLSETVNEYEAKLKDRQRVVDQLAKQLAVYEGQLRANETTAKECLKLIDVEVPLLGGSLANACDQVIRKLRTISCPQPDSPKSGAPNRPSTSSDGTSPA